MRDGGVRAIPGAAYVCFWPKRPDHWWARKYGHVSIVHYQDEAWIHQDLQQQGLCFQMVHKHDEVQAFLSHLFDNAFIVRVPVSVNPCFLAPMTCVSFVKHALGIRSRALLPDGLLRDLLRNPDAEHVNVEAQGSTAAARSASEEDEG